MGKQSRKIRKLSAKQRERVGRAVCVFARRLLRAPHDIWSAIKHKFLVVVRDKNSCQFRVDPKPGMSVQDSLAAFDAFMRFAPTEDVWITRFGVVTLGGAPVGEPLPVLGIEYDGPF